MKPTRKLTEAEIDRMQNMCASGPLNYKPEIDDELIALHLAEMWDDTEDAAVRRANTVLKETAYYMMGKLIEIRCQKI